MTTDTCTYALTATEYLYRLSGFEMTALRPEQALPPNTVSRHEHVKLTIRPSNAIHVAGDRVSGIVELACSSEQIALGRIAVELTGQERTLAELFSIERIGADIFLLLTQTYNRPTTPPLTPFSALASFSKLQTCLHQMPYMHRIRQSLGAGRRKLVLLGFHSPSCFPTIYHRLAFSRKRPQLRFPTCYVRLAKSCPVVSDTSSPSFWKCM